MSITNIIILEVIIPAYASDQPQRLPLRNRKVEFMALGDSILIKKITEKK